MPTALVTGATAGIGRSFVNLLASEHYDLVLVARDGERLENIADELSRVHGCVAEVLVADLANVDDCLRVEQRLADDQRPIDVLINNAGYGLNSTFIGGNLDDEQALFDVLTRAVMRLSHAGAHAMKARNHGIIINVSSVAGWWPTGTYSAAKAYVTAFTRGLAHELRKTNIRVSALCPGFTRTEFHARGQYEMQKLPNFLWLDADLLVRKAWRDVQRGRIVSVPGWQYRILRQILRFK